MAGCGGAEMVMNQFVGPPLGSVLIAVAFAVPFFFDAGTSAISAALIFALTGVFRVETEGELAGQERAGFWDVTKEGVRWLWAHPLLRPMAIILGLLNGLFAVMAATMVLFAQEALLVTTTTFAFLMMAGAIGGVLGSVLAPAIWKKLGSGTSLYLTLIVQALTALVIGFATHWLDAAAMFVLSAFTGVLWNVITVSLRQTIIPDHLLGRVNSVYRLFAWEMMPIGLAIGGIVVSVAETAGVDRITALRLPYFVAGAALFVVFLWAAPQLTTAKIEAARAEGTAVKEPEDAPD